VNRVRHNAGPGLFGAAAARGTSLVRYLQLRGCRRFTIEARIVLIPWTSVTVGADGLGNKKH
jgi:hypothetical protein